MSRKGVLRNLLQVDVDGQLNVLACLRHLAVILLQHRAVGGDGGDARAVRAVQLVFKGFFQALLADIGIHGIALFLVDLVFLRVHQADTAEDMRGIGRVVLSDGGGLHIGAGDVQLRDGGQRDGVHVVEQHIGGQGGPAPQIQLIADGDHAPRFLLRPVGGQIVFCLQPADELRSGDIAVPAALLQKGLEIAVPGGGIVIRRVFIGLFHGYGEVIRDFQPQLIAEIGQPAQVFIGRLGAEYYGVDEGQVVACAVADEHLTVAVKDFAACRDDAGAVFLRTAGGAVQLLGLRDLHVEKTDGKNTGHQRDQKHEHAHAKGKFMLIHSLLRFLRCI